ncbi:hydantoinase/oxoprolinase family protein [Saccharopolyspora sp. NPDC000995]
MIERMAADGRVIQEIDRASAEAALDALAATGIDTVAVCLLHSYRNPAHELAVAELAAQRHPGLIVVLSHQVSPEPREYERASTTVLDAYIRPAVDGYLGRLGHTLATGGFSGDLHVMQSNGWAMPADIVRRNAIRMLLSGPAGGISAALAVGRELGLPDLLTFDMGGTSSDICLIQGGRAEIRHDSAIDHLPIRVPMLDIVTVGSGGGSIAAVDHGGMLHVGPRSAGSEPGPACYGRGGTQATITDANVVVGLIRPERFLGGGMRLDIDAAERACTEAGARLGTDAAGGAAAILRVAGTDIAAALRLTSTERGVDPDDFWLLTYGGAGARSTPAHWPKS